MLTSNKTKDIYEKKVENENITTKNLIGTYSIFW